MVSYIGTGMQLGEWLRWFDASGWQGLIGLAITLVGFGFTFWNVIRGRRASEAAKEAAESAVAEVQKLKVVTDLSAALSELDEIRRLQREANWRPLPERLARVRKLLIGIKTRHTELGPKSLDAVRSAIIAFSETEKQVERHVRDGTQLNAAKLSSLVMEHIDSLSEVISGIV